MSQEQDKVFFRNYSIVIGILVVMIIIFIIAANALGENEAVVAERRAGDVSQRTEPVGDVQVAGEEKAAEAEPQVAAAEGGGEQSGKQVYNGLCASCHGTGLPGVPQLGDAAAWEERVAKGKDTLYNNALNGYTGSSGMMMPAKGGNPALSDAEVKAAVDYMVASSD